MNRRRSIGALCGAALDLAFATPVRSQTPTYRVGVTPSGIPFAYVDPGTHTVQGAMADVIRFVAAEAGFAVSFELAPFAALIPMLTENKIDLIGAAMVATTPRRETVDFSDAVFPYPEGLVVSISDKTPYRSLSDLNGRVVGVQAGTVYADFLRGAGEFAEVKLYPSIADMLREVSQGKLFAAFGDAPIFAYQLAQNVSLRAHLVSTYEARLTTVTSIAVRKGDGELLGKINASLAKLRSEGTIDRISARWNLR